MKRILRLCSLSSRKLELGIAGNIAVYPFRAGNLWTPRDSIVHAVYRREQRRLIFSRLEFNKAKHKALRLKTRGSKIIREISGRWELNFEHGR